MTMPDAELGAELMRRATEADCCCGPDRDLLTLLREDAPIYAGRGAIEAERLRAFVMECVGRAGLASEALPFIREELETATDPYAVAAAARAVRFLHLLPPDIERLLRDAASRIGVVDEIVCLDVYPAYPAAAGRSAVSEVEETLGIIGRIRTRHTPPTPRPDAPKDALRRLRNVELEDQDGEVMPLGQLLLGQPSTVAFFYTRCMNPNKCSLTITKLGWLQRRLSAEHMTSSVNVAGVTYDPAFDLPRRLQTYGTDRGMMFDARNRMLRTTRGFERLQRRFDLGVGYGEATVNQHRSELFVLDKRGDTIFSVTRRQWQEDEVVGALKDVLMTA